MKTEECRCRPSTALVRVTVNEISPLPKEDVLRLMRNEAKSSEFLLPKDIPKTNPYKKYTRHMKAKRTK